MRFSLVLATVGRIDEIIYLFNSLHAQTQRDFEVIIVDQNVDDRLGKLITSGQSAGLLIHYFRLSPPNLSVARNLGIEHAQGDIIAFPDDDCWYEADTLAIVDDAFRHAEIDGVVALWPEVMGESIPVFSKLSWERTRNFCDVPYSSSQLFFTNSLLHKLKGFDVRLGVSQWFGAGEETDLVMRALSNGSELAFVPRAVVHHHYCFHRFEVLTNEPLLAMLAAARQRERGTGALYAKHDLSVWVRLRGLIAPLVLAAVYRKSLRFWLRACVQILGKLEGMTVWTFLYRQEKQEKQE
jgi:glycosyltransferase involved in cell wall biosynthesis